MPTAGITKSCCKKGGRILDELTRFAVWNAQVANYFLLPIGFARRTSGTKEMSRKMSLGTIFRTACMVVVLTLMPEYSLGWQGKVIHLDDGDSGIAVYQGRRVKFRLYGIDAPELHQDFGRRARAFASNLLLGKTADFESRDRDYYDREIVIVYVAGKCINEEMIRAGLAWVYSHYCRNGPCDEWARLQKTARARRVGLWIANHPIPPREFREQHRDE
jgi:micrococcal nuclease